MAYSKLFGGENTAEHILQVVRKLLE